MSMHFLPKLAAAVLAGGLAALAMPNVPSAHMSVLFGLFSLVAVLAYVRHKFEHAFWISALAAATALGCTVTLQSVERENSRMAVRYGPVEDALVRVISDPYLEKQARVELVESPRAGREMILILRDGGTSPEYGQTIRVSGSAYGSFLTVSVWSHSDAPAPALSPLEQFRFVCLKLRDAVDRAILRAGPPPAFLAFTRAELFGKRCDLDAPMLRILQDNGLTHIIAVSGMHTTMLAAVLFFFLVPMLGRAAAGWVTIVAVAGFAAMVGLQPSVVRAAIGTSLALVGTSIGRPVRILNILSASFIVELMLFPEHLRNAGFQLSYLSVLALAVADIAIRPERFALRDGSGVLRSPPAWSRWFLPLILIQMFTAPLTAHLFYRWSWLSILSNLLFLPVFTFLICLAAVASLLAFPWPSLASALFWLGDASLRPMLHILSGLPGWFSVSSNFGQLPFWLLILFTVLWTVFLLWAPKRPRYLLGGAAVFLAMFSAYPCIHGCTVPLTLMMGGERVPYAAVIQGRRILHAQIDLPQQVPVGALRPLVKEFLREGIHTIESLDARPEVREALRIEFGLGKNPSPKSVERAEPGGFRYRNAGLDFRYLPPVSDRPETSAKERICAVAVKPDDYGHAVLRAENAPHLVYVVGRVDPDLLRRIMIDMEDRGVKMVYSSSVDGRLNIRLDEKSGWHLSTELSETMNP